MKVSVAKSAGFCFGVRRALKIAHEKACLKEKVCMLGNIVHNERVVKEIESAGIKKIKKLARGKKRILLIRAHGAAKKTFKKALSFGYKVVDATCPMVKEIHKIAQSIEKKGRKIIVIGDKKHDEVKGIVGQLKGKALVVDKMKNLNPNLLKKIKKVAIVVQSTQNIEETLKIVEKIKSYIGDLKFFNTICRPTRIKQEEVKIMSLKNDIMIIIGSKSSANTKRLYEISRSLNKKSYWIESKNNVRLSWFKGIKRVGVTAGASTPDATTEKVVNYIKEIS